MTQPIPHLKPNLRMVSNAHAFLALPQRDSWSRDTLRIKFDFQLPYLLRLPHERTMTVPVEDQVFELRCENAPAIRLLPWFAGGRYELRSLVLENPEDNFILDTSTLLSRVTLELEIQSIKNIPEKSASIIVWQQARRADVGRPNLLYLLDLAVSAFNKFLRAYRFTLNEHVNYNYLEPIYENQFPFGVGVHVDGIFVAWVFPIERISMLDEDPSAWEQVQLICNDRTIISPLDELQFNSTALFRRREHNLAIIACEQFLEMSIDRYLSSASADFKLNDDGAAYVFSGRRSEPVSVLRRYHDVLLDVEGRSLFIKKGDWWNDLDVIVSVRNSLLHSYRAEYVESKRHYDLRFGDNPVVPYRSASAVKLSRTVKLEAEFHRFLDSALAIVRWLNEGAT